jgi:hypothetical protein
MDEHQRARLWEHRLHEDIIFNERQNFFLLAESVLAVAYTEALASTEPKTVVALVIGGIAFVLTLAWLLVNRRQYAIVRHVHKRAVAYLPDFAQTYGTRPKGRISSTRILASFVPWLVVVMWLVLLGWGLHLL